MIYKPKKHTKPARLGMQTTCKHCGQDIEWQGRAGGWRDRGNNRACAAFIDQVKGEIVNPTTKHARA